MSEKPFHLAVRAIIVDEHGSCLLVRRSGTCRSFAGTWEWPGGKAELGEEVDEAVKREVREETGLEIELRGVAGAYSIEMPERRLAVLCMEARRSGGVLALSEEHDQAAWVSLGELLQWNLTDGLRQFAESYINRRGAENPRGK